MSIFRKLHPAPVSAGTLAIATAAAFFAPPVMAAHREPAAAAALDTAIARMGGPETLARIDRVRFEMMTLWQRMTFDTRPTDLISTYELHSDLRNYALVAWRNTRRFVSGPQMQEMTDIVQRTRASGASRRNPMARRRRGRRSTSPTSTSGRKSSRSLQSGCCSPPTPRAISARSPTRRSLDSPMRA